MTTISISTIARSDFRRAIDAGISKAEHLLTADAIERLKEVGRTATHVGLDFKGPKSCPGALANLPHRGIGSKDPGWVFATGYDQYVARVLKLYSFEMEVVDA